MKKILAGMMCLAAVTTAQAQKFDDYFIDKTLRIDYTFTGDAEQQKLYLNELSSLPHWAGRRNNLSEVPAHGNGQIVVRNAEDGKVIYKNAFSTLFQEWIIETNEPVSRPRGFENTFLVPFPKKNVEVEVMLFNNRQEVTTSRKLVIDPTDILIRQRGLEHITPHKYLMKSGEPKKKIDIAFVAEGYQESEMETFYKDAEVALNTLFSHEPFKSCKDRFNVVAVASPSIDSDVSVPLKGIWKQTAFGSHFSTFYSDRYLTSPYVREMHNVLAGIPYEHIIVLVNSETYGGGGIFNSYSVSTTHNDRSRPVIVHEFGHGFAGLADEYFYDEESMANFYPKDIEPWEENITTMVNFDAKWKELLKKGTPVPTNRKDAAKYKVGVFEGGGYTSKGVYSPADNCRMRTNDCPSFCPACERAIRRVIDFYTK